MRRLHLLLVGICSRSRVLDWKDQKRKKENKKDYTSRSDNDWQKNSVAQIEGQAQM